MIFKLIEEALSTSDVYQIVISAEIEPVSLHEESDLSQKPISKSATLTDIVDDKSFDEWSNFECAVQDYIEKKYKLISVSMSKNQDSLSEYFDFEVIDKSGDTKEIIINLRLSNHRMNSIARNVRMRRVRNTENSDKYRLVGVTVNGETYDTYDDAFQHFKEVLDTAINSV